jgi:hypothetical protein
MMEFFKGIHAEIERAEDFVNFLPMAYLACWVDNPGPSERAVPPFEFVFPRYSLRMLYHARNFIDKVVMILENTTSRVPTNEAFGFPIGPEAYFEFDAFLYSAKSLFEENILNKGKDYFTGERKSAFVRYAKSAYEGFVRDFLVPFRDEAVHLNFLGTSTSQMALISNEAGSIKIKLHTTFKIDGAEQNLIDLHITLLGLCIQVVRNVVRLMIHEYASVYGKPTHLNVENHVRSSIFRIGELLQVQKWKQESPQFWDAIKDDA